jgi:hypothetical protein
MQDELLKAFEQGAAIIASGHQQQHTLNLVAKYPLVCKVLSLKLISVEFNKDSTKSPMN